ncbi:hypothetical protein B1992_00540 [Pseudoxanthomonas broegbernensis]|uniref:Uncharacterized protein n=1 Tax=Pseudoxanthomonas broegbernensis TaxID=83619 RepID=A0A7V8GQ56_9GAMM|nr:hypothetical protein [Pseudoxanthomonas broegbernensis]KAF1687961.1 hypothetical protein B1992_00540 [Pseudoxanthomonas broegbernensis]MBB6064972.1 hypothetical protein [Pseudoxanthomonas broegbernensis]
MNISDEAFAGANSPLEKLELALKLELTGDKSRLELDFREAYPVLETHLAQKRRKRTLMEQFNAAYRHDVNLVQFRKLLNAERNRRGATGDLVVCTACGQPLHSVTGTNTMEDAR